ncbi:MAG: Cell cycle checkpoint protein rad17 [Claussenomyces sp. TS43310]|nr:MAG: Cell cycle checkpoint protein rad17 [Claussenomyces sp. TS43310]
MAPPAKRRKRNVVSPSSSPAPDDETQLGHATAQLTDLVSSSPIASNASPTAPKLVQTTLPMTPTKAQPKALTANHPHNAAPIYLPGRNRAGRAAGRRIPTVSPEKPKAARGKTSEKGRSRDIHTFFSSQVQRQRNVAQEPRPGHTLGTPPVALEEDGISDDDEVREKKALDTSIVGAAARKRACDVASGETDVTIGSRKFMRRPPMMTDARAEDDTRPWAERFGPVNLEELAVHKKKVTDVRGWLESVMGGQVRQRVLVLKGAAGTGKTTTIQLLAKAIDCQILEWRNPVGSLSSSDGFLSMAAQFEEFMGRGDRFGQLDIISEGRTAPSRSDAKPLDRRKSIILVEEFPNTFTRSSTALQSFRSTILRYLAVNTPSLSTMYSLQKNTEAITPLILVVSETLLTTTSASADSFTAHRLLGPEILQHPGVTVIDFNAIAPTLLFKALELVVLKESRKSGRRRTPGPLVLKRLGEIGDVRSAIGSLEFLCLRGDDNGDWGSKVTFTKAKKGAKDTPLTRMEQESLELVTRREASLGIFHAVGKVVYNKRDEVARSDGVEALPEWMEERARPRKSQVMIDELIDETGTDTQTFVAALHENYALSCVSSPSDMNGFSDLDHANGCLDALSDSDLLCPSWDGSFNSTGFGGAIGGRGSGGDVLRQDELCFQLAVRGILFALPCPVKRRAASAGAPGTRSGRGGDAFKMFYPTSLKLWRAREEIESSIDFWVARLMRGDDTTSKPLGALAAAAAAAAPLARPKPGSVESWNGRHSKPGDNEETTPVSATGTSARQEMLLERLPYMVLMAKACTGGTSPVIREMEKVTAFVGIGGPSEDDDDDDDDDDEEEEGSHGVVVPTTAAAAIPGWATDWPGDGDEEVVGGRRRWRGKKGVDNGKGRGMMMPPSSGMGTVGLETRFAEQKLVLSDDDIEDD